MGLSPETLCSGHGDAVSTGVMCLRTTYVGGLDLKAEGGVGREDLWGESLGMGWVLKDRLG